ncbi:MAG: ubiquinone/menaquinone biosynthesis methyltransferase, partial [Pyrinomonadaceae bacterium]|nr:ubiquinone/menaquinone biosynthesis methyltransferase [Pyrinomonadaceae bacterium]
MANERTANEIEHARWVREMFGNIATRYDFINRVLAINIDQSWRRKVAKMLAPILAMPNAVVLDIACGTGDLSLELHKGAKAKVIGTDFCRPMLELAKVKTAKQNAQIPYIEGDGLALPFADNTFNAVTVSFGLRNFASWEDGLMEMSRILKPGGQLIVLEFGSPNIPVFKQTYDFYFDNVLPKLGGMLSGN